MMHRIAWALAGLAALTASASAHYNMLLPASPSIKRGAAVDITCQWGHPFENQLFDAPVPQSLVVLTPDGKKLDLTKSLVSDSVQGNDGKKHITHRLRYTPEVRGDHVLMLRVPPIWMEEDQEYLQDTVVTVLHVQSQVGWDRDLTEGFVLQPLTRPYGLVPGLAFQAQAVLDGKPVARALVEVERYNPEAPKELPADEFITRAMRAGPDGVATATLPEAGWWCLTAQREGGQRDHNGKPFPVRQRASFWVHVDAKAH